MNEFSGLFIYLKIDGFVNGWYNVIGYVGEASSATSYLNIERPIIQYNGTYMEVIYEYGTGIVGLNGIEENYQLLISDKNYFTTVQDSSGAAIGTITNDRPIEYNVSIKNVQDINSKFTYYTYTVKLDNDTLNAIRTDSTTIYQNGPTLAVLDSNVDLSVETNPQGCVLNPRSGSNGLERLPNLKSDKNYIITFEFSNYIVSEGPQYGGDYQKRPIIYNSRKEVALEAKSVDFENGKFIFDATIEDKGDYTLYVPPGIFTLESYGTQISSGAIVAKYGVGKSDDVEDNDISYYPTETTSLSSITIVSKFAISAVTASQFKLYNQLDQEITGLSIQFDASTKTKVVVNLPSTITNVGLDDDVIYTLRLFPNAFSQEGSNVAWPSEVQELPIKLLAPSDIPVKTVTVSGPTKITEAGSYTYKVKVSPPRALQNYTLTYECEDPQTDISLNGNILTVGAVTDSMNFDLVLVATSVENASKVGRLTVKVSPITEDIIKVAGIKLDGPTEITSTGTYTYDVSLSPIDTTQQEYYWESSNSNYATFNEGSLVVTSLPSAAEVITIKAISLVNSDIYGFLKVTLINNKIKLTSIGIVGPREISVGQSADYSVLYNPENATIKNFTWSTAKMSDGNALLQGYSFSNGKLTVDKTYGSGDDIKYVEAGEVILKVIGPDNLTDQILVKVKDPSIISPSYNITSLDFVGPISINSPGDYSYKPVFEPPTTTATQVFWSIIDGDYPGINVSGLGTLQIKELPLYNHDITLRCYSAVRSGIYKDHIISLLANQVDEDAEIGNADYSFGSTPTAGVVTSLSSLSINITTSQTVKRKLDISDIVFNTPDGRETITGSMGINPSGSGNNKYFNLTLPKVYTDRGNYSLTFPEGFFTIGTEDSRSFTLNFYIKSGDQTESDDHSDSFGGLLAYTRNTKHTRVKDTVIVAEENGFNPSVYLTPSVYYIDSAGDYKVVSDAVVGLTYKYSDQEGTHTGTLESIPYRQGFNITEELLPIGARTFEAIVTIRFLDLTVTKHFSLEFVDIESYDRIVEDSEYFYEVTDLTNTFQEVKAMYGCSKITGFEVVQTIQDNDGIQHKLCDDKIFDVLRLGNLENVFNEKFGKRQPHGYGLYSENVYLTGEFLLSNGKSLLDISDTITAAVGNVERVQALIAQTRSDLLESFKQTVQSLNDSLELMNNISESSLLKLENIGADGIIAVEEKTVLKSNWVVCVDVFNKIQTQIYNLKETILEDATYDAVCKANVDLVRAFYDLNQITQDFLLNINLWNQPIYDKTDANDIISINQYFHDQVRIDSFVNRSPKPNKEDEPEETEEEDPDLEEHIFITDYTLKDDIILQYSIKEKEVKYPMYLYPTTELISRIPQEEQETNGPKFKYEYKSEKGKVKLNYFYEKNIFEYKKIVEEYQRLLQTVERLLGKSVSIESLVEKFRVNGELSADSAIRKYMGNLQDAAMYLGLDYSTFAMGSAGIAITNPDLTYKVNGLTLTGYINSFLESDSYKKERDKLTEEYNTAKNKYEEVKRDFEETPDDEELKKKDLKKKLEKYLAIYEASELALLEQQKNAVKNGMVLYNQDLRNADPSMIEVDENTVGDGDEQLYLFGDKIKVLTTARTKFGSEWYYEVEFYKDVKDDTGGSTRQLVRGYVKSIDLKRLKGNYTDHMLNLYDQAQRKITTQHLSKITQIDENHVSIDGTLVNSYQKNEDGSFATDDKGNKLEEPIYYYRLQENTDTEGNITKVPVQEGVIPLGTQVTILYQQAAMFEGDKLNAEFIQARHLIAGTFVDGVLDENKPYVKIGVKQKESDPIIEAVGGNFTLGTKEGSHLLLSSGEVNEQGFATKPAGLYMYDKYGNEFAKFTGEQDKNPLAKIKGVGKELQEQRGSLELSQIDFQKPTLFYGNNIIGGTGSLVADISTSIISNRYQPQGITEGASSSYLDINLQRLNAYLLPTDYYGTPRLNIDYDKYNAGIIQSSIETRITVYNSEDESIVEQILVGTAYMNFRYLNARLGNIDSSPNLNGSFSYKSATINYYDANLTPMQNYSNRIQVKKGYEIEISCVIKAHLECQCVGDKSSIESSLQSNPLKLNFSNLGYNIILGGFNNKYLCNFFGNGIVLGSNAFNYFGAYFSNPDKDQNTVKPLTFEFQSNGYGMQYDKENLNTIFNGFPLRMPYTIYAGKFEFLSRKKGGDDGYTVKFSISNLSYFPQEYEKDAEGNYKLDEAGNKKPTKEVAEIKWYKNGETHADKGGRYTIIINNIPDVLLLDPTQSKQNTFVQATGLATSNGLAYVTVIDYYYTKGTSGNTLTIHVATSDDASGNDRSFFLKVEYYPGGHFKGDVTGGSISGESGTITETVYTYADWKDKEYSKLLWGRTDVSDDCIKYPEKYEDTKDDPTGSSLKYINWPTLQYHSILDGIKQATVHQSIYKVKNPDYKNSADTNVIYESTSRVIENYKQLFTNIGGLLYGSAKFDNAEDLYKRGYNLLKGCTDATGSADEGTTYTDAYYKNAFGDYIKMMYGNNTPSTSNTNAKTYHDILEELVPIKNSGASLMGIEVCSSPGSQSGVLYVVLK